MTFFSKVYIKILKSKIFLLLQFHSPFPFIAIILIEQVLEDTHQFKLFYFQFALIIFCISILVVRLNRRTQFNFQQFNECLLSEVLELRSILIILRANYVKLRHSNWNLDSFHAGEGNFYVICKNKKIILFQIINTVGI